jgi:hypothetical protein
MPKREPFVRGIAQRTVKNMKNLVNTLLCAGVLATMAGIASAEQVSGVLMDKLCSPKAVKGGQEEAAKHPRTCNLTANCSKSGYGVYTADNKYLTFDAAGNALALKALQASQKTADMKVTVTGDVQGDTIKVTDLKLAE